MARRSGALPIPRKEKKAQKKAAEASRKTPEEKTKPKAAGGTPPAEAQRFPELRELAGTALGALKRTLRRTCRRTRIDPLEVGVIFAGDDPADTAQTYGYANAALWTLMPKLEELFYIPKPSVYLGNGLSPKAETSAEGTVGVSLRVCDLFAILLYVGGAGGKNGSCVGAGRTGRGKSGAAGGARLRRKRTNRKNGLHRKEDQDGEQGKKFGERADGDYGDEDPRNGGFNSVIGEPITTPDGVTLIPCPQ